MKKKIKFKAFPVYEKTLGNNIQLLIGEDYKEANKYINKNFAGAYEIESNVCLGFTQYIVNEKIGTETCLMWVKLPSSNLKLIGTVSHESVHAADFLLSRIGITLDGKRPISEVYAYVIEFYIKTILGIIANHVK